MQEPQETLKKRDRAWRRGRKKWAALWGQFAASVAFYTCLPLPANWSLDFQGIARFAPLVGVAIGILLGLGDGLLALLGAPVLTRSTLVVLAWICVTGGLHLDGVVDAADGLVVSDPKRRLRVMAESTAGAYGIMGAIAVVALKVAALTDLSSHRALVLMAAAGWGRWGQLVAIACYPYLKASGKGAFHKEHFHSPLSLLPGSFLLLGLSGAQILWQPEQWFFGTAIALAGSAIAVLTGAWFNAKLGGHTGDTYGAVVEWTEALLLCLLAIVGAGN